MPSLLNQHLRKKELAAREVIGIEKVLSHLMELRKTEKDNAWLETLIHASAKQAVESRVRFLKRFREFPAVLEETQ